MIKRYIIYSFIALIVAGSSLITSGNLIFAVVVFVLFALYFILYERLVNLARDKKNKKDLDLNIFIHDFILAYSHHSSLEEAINQSTINVSYPLVEHLKLLEEYDIMERLNQLSSYFNDPFYQLFLQTITLANENKSDILKSGNFLLEENDRIIHERKLKNKNVYKALGEFILLWAVSFLVLLIMRFAINNHFAKISSSWIYLLGLGIYYAFFLLSIYLFMYTANRSLKI